jgi:hypothetical protein
MREEEMIVFLALITAIAIVPLCWVIAHYAYLACKHWQATRLVREMVARGYSSQEILEICHVLGHRPRGWGKRRGGDVPLAKPIKQPAYG